MRNTNNTNLTGLQSRNSSSISQIFVNDHIRGGTFDSRKNELKQSAKRISLMREELLSKDSEEKLNQAFKKALDEANLSSTSRVEVYEDPQIHQQHEDQIRMTRQTQSKFIIKKGIRKRALGFRENSIRLSQRGVHVFIPPPLKNGPTPDKLSSVNEECISKGYIETPRDHFNDKNIMVDDQYNNSQPGSNAHLSQKFVRLRRNTSYLNSQQVTRNTSKEKISVQEKEHMLNITSSHLDVEKDILYADNTNFIVGNPLEKNHTCTEGAKLITNDSKILSSSDASEEKTILKSVGTNVGLNGPFAFNSDDYKLPSRK
ncbi:unnamed protein product [Moneuplotes crassus]|uniref:Uncharacterized protein n=1 Tax=Euplotes crassus TaxID=5936 RepID=A0AAD1XZR0_EUPCR|nr:unnamed protein product [Moneuplotes crassus]